MPSLVFPGDHASDYPRRRCRCIWHRNSRCYGRHSINPNASQQLALANFTGKLDITVGPPSSFDFNGSFTLGSGSTGINPSATGLTLTVGTFSVVVPANSFIKTSKGVFVCEGTIDGVPLQFRIAPTTATNAYSLQVEASGINMPNATNPVPVKLVLGSNDGSTQVKAQLQ